MKPGTKIAVGLALCFVVGAIILMAAHRARLRESVEREIARIRASGAPVTATDLAGDPVPDDQNAAIVYQDIFNAIETRTSYNSDVISDIVPSDQRVTSPEVWKRARQVVSDNEDLFARVEEAVSRPHCKFRVDWRKGYDVPRPHLYQMRELARFLTARAVVRARDGDIDGAVRTVALCFQVSQSIKNEPELIGQFVRVAIIKIAAGGVRQIIEAAPIRRAQAEQLFDVLADIELRSGFVRAFEGERALGMWRFSEIRAGRNVMDAPRHLLGALSLYDEELYHLDLMQKQIDAARLPYHQMKASKSVLDPMFTRTLAARSVGQAHVALTQLFLALEAYRGRFASYPPSLDDVRAKLGWKLPDDPFSGKDLIYKPENDGFTIYSIGPDLIDSGGRPQAESGEPSGPGDVVWKHTLP